MGFDTIIGILLSIWFPEFIRKKSERQSTEAEFAIKLFIILGVFFLVTSFNYLSKLILNDKVYESLQNGIVGIVIRIAFILGLGILIFLSYRDKFQGVCGFKVLQEKITTFTENASGDQAENSELYILCGDMDVWGASEDSKEFLQLFNLQKSYQNLDIRILCKHCIKEEYVKKIAGDDYTFDPKEFRANVLNEEQIFRISDFKEKLVKCSFRFYKNPSDDLSHLRARVIRKPDSPNNVLIYQKTNQRFGRLMQYINKEFKGEDDPLIYEYTEFADRADNRKMHYVELCNLKWNNCDAGLSERIVNCCQQYVKYERTKESVKKVLFVYAETYEVAHYGTSRREFPPFGVLYLASAVKNAKSNWMAEVTALTENKLLDQDKLRADFSQYDVVAFSIISAYTVPLFVEAMKCIKYGTGERPVCIAGGYQAEIEREELLKKKYVSLVLRGEGEKTIVDLLTGSSKQKFGPKLYAGLSGACYMSDDRIVESKAPPVCVDLNRIPIPDRSVLTPDSIAMYRDIAGNKYKMAHILMSRGCSYRCAYCGVRREGNRTVRYRNVKNILQELNSLKENYEIEAFSIVDDCFLTNKEQSVNILKELVSVGLIWSLAARIDQIDEEVLKYLKESGCREIKFGLETGSDTILQKMDKGITVAQARKVLNQVYEAGISAKIFIISGLPGETEQTNQETIDFLKEMGKEKIRRVSLLRFVPLPGSKVYDDPDTYGIRADIKNTLNNLDQYKKYRLYNEETNWWKDETEFKTRVKCYNKLKNFIDSIWPKEVY